MPGKRYDLRITHGPFKGCRARFTAQDLPTGTFVLEASVGYRRTQAVYLKPEHFRRIPTTRPHRRSRPR